MVANWSGPIDHEFVPELFPRRDEIGEGNGDAIDLGTPRVRHDADFHAPHNFRPM